MIKPGHLRCASEQGLELSAPDCAFQRQQSRKEISEPLGVKLDVTHFIGEQKRAGFVQDRVARARPQQTVIGRPHQFRDDEELNLELESDPLPDQPEESMRPMTANGSAAKTAHQTFEQSRMLVFFCDEKLQRIMIGGVVRRLRPSAGQKEFTLAGFAQLEMRQGPCQDELNFRIERAGRIPFRFGPVSLVTLIISEPLL